MARPIKIGLDYFPMDTTWDIKMRLLKARYKLEGIGLIVELYQAIYREGYALIWNDDSRLLIADEVGVPPDRLDEIVGFAAAKGIFNKEALKKGYLTSHGIQARWVKACTESKRKENKIPPEIDLLQRGNEFTPEETRINSEETKEKLEFSTQIKVKEIKVNEIKEEKSAREEQPPPPVKTFPPALRIQESLILPIRKSFEYFNPQGFTDPRLEDPAIVNLAEKFARLGRDNPGDFARAVLEKFHELTVSQDKFWRGQPYTPSSLNNPKIFDRVIAEMKTEEVQDERESWADMEIRLRAKMKAEATA